MPVGLASAAGVSRGCELGASPSCPLASSPQQRAVPSLISAQPWAYPSAIDVTVSEPPLLVLLALLALLALLLLLVFPDEPVLELAPPVVDSPGTGSPLRAPHVARTASAAADANAARAAFT
jgi:hypothetical protein